jgi:hypothetical protein
VQAEFALMSREERLRLRFQAMARDLDDEPDLDELDALRLIHFMGKDFKDRTVVYLSGANLMVRLPLAHCCALAGWSCGPLTVTSSHVNVPEVFG